jgi:hypothetical protein
LLESHSDVDKGAVERRDLDEIPRAVSTNVHHHRRTAREEVFEASAQVGAPLVVPGLNRSAVDRGIESERVEFVSQGRIDERLATVIV